MKEGTHSVPKCRHVKFRRQGITQKKTYKIRQTAVFEIETLEVVLKVVELWQLS
jgi:hypothetical protein